MIDQIKIGSFLRELRKEKELTQEQLAEKFGGYTLLCSHNEPVRNGDFLTQVSQAMDAVIQHKTTPEKEGGLYLHRWNDISILTSISG